MSNYIQLKLAHPEKEILEIFIALLSEQGFEGFEESPQQLSAFIPEEQWDEEAIKELVNTYQATYTTETIAQRNWNEEWEKNFEPVVVGEFCAVRAHFHAPIKDVAYEIIITPKMSFGTGHHATTYMMIEYMEQLDFTGKTVLDFGTGTGILAILAAMKGAKHIVAIDNDDWSVENAAENIEVNRKREEATSATNIVLEKADSLEKFAVFNIILANINKHVLLANMGAIQQHLTPGGVIIMSGLLAGDREDIEKSANNNGLKIVDQKQQQAWIALQLTTR
jgi:ribosomal protein L11 methyltransferase